MTGSSYDEEGEGRACIDPTRLQLLFAATVADPIARKACKCEKERCHVLRV